MPHPHPFVGRKIEIEQFESVLAGPTPQAVLIVGHQGMGKSMLARKFHDMALPHANTGGGSFVFQVRKDQSIGGTLEDVLAEAKQAAHAAFGSYRFTGVRQKIWSGLISLIVRSGGSEIAKALVGEEPGDTARKFIRFLTEWGAKLPDDSRVLFVFDSDKYMPAASADSWRSLVEELPPKFKLVFAQRPDDVLARDIGFNHLADRGKLVRWEIGVLVDDDRNRCVAKLAEYRRPVASEDVVRAVFTRYDGHPFAVQGGLDLVALGTAIENLPIDPTDPTEGIAAEQWRYVAKRGDEAMRLLKAYAVLEVPVPDDVACDVAGINRESFERLSTHDDFVSGLLAGTDGDRQIYHSLLSEYVVRHVLDDDAEAYHRRAIDLFRRKLERAREAQSAPDILAAERLAEHVLAADGVEAFVDCFVDECTKPLVNLGRLDAAIDLSGRALGLVTDDPSRTAVLSGNQGLIHRRRGDLEKAEKMHRKSLVIEEKLGRLEGMASDYGNLGLIHRTRGDLDKAEEMHRKSLEIHEKLGRLEGMACDYGNQGLIHRRRGDLDRAEEMHRKALEIEKKLGRLEGMASEYGNLGSVAKQRGDFTQARELWTKARDLFERIGMPHVVKQTQGVLDSLPPDDPH